MAVTKIGKYAFCKHPNLETVRISASTIEPYAFQDCGKLISVDLTSASPVSIGANSFYNSNALKHLIIRSESLSTLASTNALPDSYKATRSGIYVPSNLLNSYKSASNWSVFASCIFPISEYPKENFDTITDSWSTILSDPNPSSSYNIGDVKTLTLNGTVDVPVQIVAFNSDTLASDSTKKASITWILKNHYPGVAHIMNSSATTAGGWEACGMRSWLISDILPLLEASDVGPYLQTVTKTYRTKHTDDGDATKSCSDKIWLPSAREVNLIADINESDGAQYSSLFPAGTSSEAKTARIKYNVANTATSWPTRTASNGTQYIVISASGSYSASGATNNNGIVFGFCTGVSS